MSITVSRSEQFEDKKCRICGLADKSNINIFNDKILRMKICTVYPIVLHQDDPFPKNICRKCVSTVSSMYNDIQRFKKLQSKWTQNVRDSEPQNKFLQSLDLLESAAEAIKNLMNTTFNTTISKETIHQIITAALGEIENLEATKDCKSKDSLSLNGEISFPQIKEEATNADEEEENLSLSKVAANKKASTESPLLTVKCGYCPLKFESLARLSLHQNNHMRLRISKIFPTKFLNKKSRRGRLITTKDRQSIRCLNCWRVFDDNKCILEHWSKAECDFYCQICGKEYEQSPKMLREHVSETHGISYKSLKTQRDRFTKKTSSPNKPKHKSEFIANKNTKSQKEHTPLSSVQLAPTKINTEVAKNAPQAVSYSASKLVTCRICSRSFQNFKACNSHMRAHKPPYAYGETAPLPDVDADSYMEFDHKNIKKEPQTKADCPQNDISATASSTIPAKAVVPSAIPSHFIPNNNETAKYQELESNKETKVNSTALAAASPTATKISTTTAPRGIRMKFVSRRCDLNGSSPSIKVKSLSDLQGAQQNKFTPKHSPGVNKVQNVLPSTSPSIPINASLISPNVKDEPFDNMLLQF